MKTIEINLYQFDELSDEAKRKAIENYRDTHTEVNWADENRETLEAFERSFPVNITSWSYNGRGEGILFNMDEANDGIYNLKGSRLIAYLYNNNFNDLFKGKYFSLWSKTDANPHYTEGGHAPKGKLKSIHSKVMMEKQCTLTGYYLDNVILSPIYETLEGKRMDTSFKEIIKECFNEWVQGCNEDIENQNSDEFITEEIEANEYDFRESGELYS